MNESRLRLIVTIAAAATLLLLGRALSHLVVEHAWFTAMAAGALWREHLLALAVLKGAGWLAGSLFAFANLWAVRRTIRSIAVPTRVADLELVEVLPSHRLLHATLAVAAAVGFLLTLPLDDWTLLSAAWRGLDFSEYEGFFQRDLGFYVHWLPFESMLYTWALIAIAVVAVLVTLLYALTRSVRIENRQLIVNHHVRRHFTVLAAMVLLLLSWSYRLDAYERLLWGSGFDGLFTPIDHRYITRVDMALAVCTFAAALIVLRTGWIGQVRAAFITVSLVLAGSLTLRQLGPEIVRRGALVDTREIIARDYAATRALFTRRAYGVETMRTTTAEGANPRALSRAPALSGIAGRGPDLTDLFKQTALWDAAVFTGLRAVSEAPIAAVLPPAWQRGPHGPDAIVVTRTAAATPVWDIRIVAGAPPDERGAPVLARDAVLRGIALPEPLVAPGMLGHRVVEADPPSATGIAEGADRLAPREGPFDDRMIPAASLSGSIARLAHAWATRDITLLRDRGVDGTGTAVVMHRDVRHRLARLAPTLVQGTAITPIMDGVALIWAVDLYSASAHYPLSARFSLAGAPRSYFRHAATALVDAGTGAVRFVPVDDPDPIARTWLGLIATLVLPMDELPDALRDRLPIPSDGALGTLRAFTRVGSRRTGYAASYVPDSLPGSEPFPVTITDDGAIAWAVPLVNEADELVGIFEAGGGAMRRPVWRPIAEPLPRWSALTARLGAALDSVTTEVASAADGPLVAGTIRVRAIAGRPWLVRPVYADAGGALHLVAIAAASESTARAAPSLDAFRRDERSEPDSPRGEPRTDAWRAAESRRLYDALREALRRSDWIRFGVTMDSLGRVLDRTP
jgi:hypothetical protein